MKKLMTTLSAIAVAFGLQVVGAADTGTSFEGLPGDSAGIAYDIYAVGGNEYGGGEIGGLDEGQTYWVTNATAEIPDLKVIAGESIQHPYRPLQFDDADQEKYLHIETKLGNPVTRNVSTNGEGTAIGDGFYFDSLVKFTAFDTDPAISLGNDGKLAIWLKEEYVGESLEPSKTNLMITAGYLDADLGEVVATNYTCIVGSDANYLGDGNWHRVTVKAINNIYDSNPTVPGFVVFIDKMKVKSSADKGIDETRLNVQADTYNQDGALFPSAVQADNVQSGIEKSKIKSVSFDGKGDIDDIVFTATAPDFADIKSYVIRLGQNVTNVTYTAYNSGGDEIESGNLTSETPVKSFTYEANMYVEVSDILCADGYMTNGVAGVQANASGYYKPSAPNQYTEFLAKSAGASVNGVPYETLAEAIGAIAGVGESSVKLKLTANAVLSGALPQFNAAGKDVILDLAGYNIVGPATGNGVIVIGSSGCLEITNSTETVGHVIASSASQSAVVASGSLTIRDGVYDGWVRLVNTNGKFISGGKFQIASNGDTARLAALNTAVENALTDAYALVEEAEESPVYYVVDLKPTPTIVTVNFINGELIVATTNIEVGTTLVAPATVPEKTGYTFRAWVTTDDPAEDWNFADPVTEAMALVADFNINQYNVTFDSNGGSYAPESIKVDYNDYAAKPYPDPTKDGYEFLGWFAPEAATAFDFEETPITGDTSLTAHWAIKTCTITFDANGGSVDPASTNFTIETGTITLPTATIAPEVGVYFDGWTNAVIVEAITEFTPTASNLDDFTLYAKWSVPAPPTKHDAGETIACADAEEAADLAAAITANPAAYVNVPEGVAQGAAYCALFQGVADGSSVTIVLTDAATNTVQTAVDAAMETVPLAALASGSEEQQYVRVTAIPGLYYSVSVGASCTSLSEVTPRTLAQDTGAGANIGQDGKISIPVSRPAGLGVTAGFYKVNANIEPAPLD